MLNNILAILLILIILFMILFGCKCNKYEKFENNKTEEKKEEDNKLSQFENSILKGLTSGTITSSVLSDLIKTEKFTSENLENLISHVEKFKGGLAY